GRHRPGHRAALDRPRGRGRPGPGSRARSRHGKQVEVMQLQINGKAAFAYTAAHDIDPAKRTVVFVHGAGLDHSGWGLQSRYFGYHGFNVLAVDLPAHGRSEGPALNSVGEMADWVSAVLKQLNIAKASLAGHSMGSLVALEFAARYPE